MITGIVPAQNFLERGMPWDLAIGCWTDVCDEIIIVTSLDDNGIGELNVLANKLSSRCSIKVRGVLGPKYFELFRFIGYFFCQQPGWVVHFDLDYLISPQQAFKLRNLILAASEDLDALLYRLVYLNRDATRKVFNQDMLRFCPPYDGFQGDYPFVVNTKRQVFVSPMMAMMESGLYVDYEGLVSLNPIHWGKSLYMKYNNPNGFDVRNTGVLVEHLSYSLEENLLKRKLNQMCYQNPGLDFDYVCRGQEDYNVSYPALDEARSRY